MTVRFIFTAKHADFPSACFPMLKYTTGGSSYRPVLAFDDTSTERCWFEGMAASGWSGSLSASILSFSACSTSGSVVWGLAVETISPGDALDLRNASTLATTSCVLVGVPAASGQLLSAVVNPDDGGLVSGDNVRFYLTRAVGDAGDDSVGDHNFYKLIIADGRA